MRRLSRRPCRPELRCISYVHSSTLQSNLAFDVLNRSRALISASWYVGGGDERVGAGVSRFLLVTSIVSLLHLLNVLLMWLLFRVIAPLLSLSFSHEKRCLSCGR